MPRVQLIVGLFLHLGFIRPTAIDRYQFQTSRTALEQDLIDPLLALLDFALSIDLFGKSQLGVSVPRPGLGVRVSACWARATAFWITSVAESDVSARTLEGPIKPKPNRTTQPTQTFAELTNFMLLAVYATFHRKASQKRPYFVRFPGFVHRKAQGGKRQAQSARRKAQSWRREALPALRLPLSAPRPSFQPLAFDQEQGQRVPGVLVGAHNAVGHFQAAEEFDVPSHESLESRQILFTNGSRGNHTT